MTTKLNKKVTAVILALSAGMLLASCDSIEAIPNNYESPIAIKDSDQTKVDVYENIMGILYDGVSSSKSSDVLSNFMDIVSNDQFGTYKELKEVVTSGDEAKLTSFVEKHKIYIHTKKYQLENGEVTEDEYLAHEYGISEAKVRNERVVAFYNSIQDKINEEFYDLITGSTYKDDTGKFYEQRLAIGLVGQMYEVTLEKEGGAPLEWYEGYITPELKKTDVKSFVHLDDGRYDDYIERKLVREIYKDKLVEEYLLANNYSTLGRAYGRKVNIVKLTRDDKYKDLPGKLLKQYSKSYITVKGANIDFETIANAWRGFKGIDKAGNVLECSAEEKKLLTDIGLVEKTETIGGVVYNYFAETKYGQLIEDYLKIKEIEDDSKYGGRFASDEAVTALNKFTGNLTYTKEKGLKIELAKIAIEDYTTDGYYVKNGGLSDLPETIRNRLFNIKVSNEVDSGEEYEKGDYTKLINGHSYLTPAISETGDDENYIIFDNNTYYLIEVVEAPSTSKLSITNSSSYVEKRKDEGVLFTEKVARELATTLGTKDSYVDDAYASFIEQYSLQYHDSKIYDYFYEKYPELFED